MKKLLLLLLCTSLAYAQQDDNPPVTCGGSAVPSSAIDTFKSAITQPGASITFNGLTSSALQSSEFTSARVVSNGQSIIMPARVNILSNTLEIKNQNGKIFELKKEDGISLTFLNSNDIYKSTSYVDPKGNTKTDYFIYEPNSTNQSLLKKITYKYIKAKKATSSYGKDKPATFKKSVNYFYKTTYNALVDLSVKKKTIIKNFKGDSKALLAFMKKNNTNFEKESDLSKLAIYMNTLELNLDTNSALASNR